MAVSGWRKHGSSCQVGAFKAVRVRFEHEWQFMAGRSVHGSSCQVGAFMTDRVRSGGSVHGSSCQIREC
jgi:hypothetical protein